MPNAAEKKKKCSGRRYKTCAFQVLACHSKNAGPQMLSLNLSIQWKHQLGSSLRSLPVQGFCNSSNKTSSFLLGHCHASNDYNRKRLFSSTGRWQHLQLSHQDSHHPTSMHTTKVLQLSSVAQREWEWSCSPVSDSCPSDDWLYASAWDLHQLILLLSPPLPWGEGVASMCPSQAHLASFCEATTQVWGTR